MRPAMGMVRSALVLLLLISLGCGPAGPRTYPVRGTVTFDGEPVSDGYITFSPTDRSATPAAGKIVAGEFDFRATAGEKRVEIEASRFVGPENPIMGLRPREAYIPARYNRQTMLQATVDAKGKNEYEFALASDTDDTSGAE